MTGLAGQTLGPYLIREQIGGGGMGRVYRAYHPATDRDVAIKVLSPDLAGIPDFQARFEREARVVASLQHIHILPLFDYGQAEDLPYLVMPYISGGTLRDYLDANRPSIQEAARLFTQIADAVHYAHQHNVLHRDLKPANVLLDTNGNALLTDFGLTRMAELGSSLTGSQAIGTPSYMSPEQSQGAAVDTRTDIYALGILLYELMTGSVPFHADTPLALLFKHVTQSPPAPRAQCPDLDPAIEKVILKALAKQPDDRYQTAGAMVEALQRALAGGLETEAGTQPALHEADLTPTVIGDPALQAAAPTRPAVVDQETVRQREPARRWNRRWAWVIGVVVILAVAGFVVRTAIATQQLSAALHAENEEAAEAALSTAAMLGADVTTALRDELVQALDRADTDYALRIARLCASHGAVDPALIADIEAQVYAAASDGLQPLALRLVGVLVVLSPAQASSLAGDLNDAAVAALATIPPQDSAARVYLEAVRYLDEALDTGRSGAQRSTSLYNLAQLQEQDAPDAAVEAYRAAIQLNSANVEAYYGLSSLLLTEFASDQTRLNETVSTAQAGREHVEPEYCEAFNHLADEAAFVQSWLCFLLLTTEGGARIERGDSAAVVRPLLDQAAALAAANEQFGYGYFTAEVYYYLAILSEPDAPQEILCQIIQNHNRDLERHRAWAIYANEQLGDRHCTPGS
ncbi:MAG: protein kinase [Anaerolineae bacterium]|nr:protein kinase [Anaerolineae bacterium]